MLVFRYANQATIIMESKKKVEQKLLSYQKRIFEETELWQKNLGTVLDVGCGRGDDARLFATWGNQVTGVDIATNPQWHIAKSANLNFLKSNGENLSFKDHSFDLVFSKDVLHHTSNPKKMLEEARRVCKKKGLIVFVEANRYNPITYFHMAKKLKHNHFTQKQFHKIVGDIFPEAMIGSFEAHYYPLIPVRAAKLLAILEIILPKFGFIKPLMSYNFFSIIKT